VLGLPLRLPSVQVVATLLPFEQDSSPADGAGPQKARRLPSPPSLGEPSRRTRVRPRVEKERSSTDAQSSITLPEPCSDFGSVRSFRAARAALECSRLSSTDRLVARLIMDHVDASGCAFPSQTLLAQRANFSSVTTVKNSIARLKAAAKDPSATFWIVVQKDWKNTYQIVYRPQPAALLPKIPIPARNRASRRSGQAARRSLPCYAPRATL
jgi:hypothetical protein